LQTAPCSATRVASKVHEPRQCRGGKNAKDDDYDDQFDQGKTFLPHLTSPWKNRNTWQHSNSRLELAA
jgi:hypothetical protein